MPTNDSMTEDCSELASPEGGAKNTTDRQPHSNAFQLKVQILICHWTNKIKIAPLCTSRLSIISKFKVSDLLSFLFDLLRI